MGLLFALIASLAGASPAAAQTDPMSDLSAGLKGYAANQAVQGFYDMQRKSTTYTPGAPWQPGSTTTTVYPQQPTQPDYNAQPSFGNFGH